MKERERLPELLVPAGGREQLESAILYGADAVYMGGPELSLRTACEGFSGEELGLAVADAHTAGVRVYYCLNAMPYDAQLPAVEAVLERLPGMGVDGLIAADPGVIWLAKKHCPSVPLHLSTQAHSVNGAAVAFWREAGVERINLARELGFKQIRALAEAFPGVDFEVFVHGAMCLALSGHCLLSAWVNNRPANQGRCTQPCRFEYRGLSLLVEEQKRSGEALWEIREGEAFSGFWAPQDLCLLRYVGCLADLGVRALKLEGRTKSGGYVAQIADPEGDGWRVQVRSPWSSDREASVLVPGMRRPALLPGAYQLENHRGERVDLLHPGMEGVLHCEIDGLGKGLYVRA